MHIKLKTGTLLLHVLARTKQLNFLLKSWLILYELKVLCSQFVVNDMSTFSHRDDVLQSLSIVQHCLLGAGCMFPPLGGPPITTL